MREKTIFHVALVVGAVAIVGTALALAFGGSNGASGAADDRYLAHDWESKNRDLAFESDRMRSFEFESTRAANGSHEIIRGRFDLHDATYRLAFESEPQAGVEGIAPPTNESWLAMSLRFVEVLEYRDNTSDGRFTPATDTIVDRRKLEDLGDFGFDVDEPVPGRHVVAATYSFPQGGDLEVEFRVTSHAYTLGERKVRPTVTDLDVRLDDYPYEHEDTRLALHSKVSAPGPLAFDADGEGVEVEAEGGDRPFVGRYTWADELAVGDDTVNPVLIEAPPETTPGTRSEATLLTSYPRADLVEHTTAMGVHHDRPIPQQVLGFVGNPIVFGAALVASLVVLGGSMYVKMRNEDTGPPYP